MGENTKIQWAHHTFNCWRGCQKISPGCANCYAETQSKRNPNVLGSWGPGGKRIIAAESYWRLPLKWDREAQCNCGAAGTGEATCAWCAGGCQRPRVFCASLADVFEDRPELVEPRMRLFALINETPNLDWLLLTKRPEQMQYWINWFGMSDDAPPLGRWLFKNLWLGVSIEDRQRLDERSMILSATPAAIRFWSVEPLLEDLGNIRGYLEQNVDWVIIGGESGHGARPFNVAWARSIIAQCKEKKVPLFLKQLGARVLMPNDSFSEWPRDGDGLCYDADQAGCHQGDLVTVGLIDRKGGDPEEWPEDLRVREFPSVKE